MCVSYTVISFKTKKNRQKNREKIQNADIQVYSFSHSLPSKFKACCPEYQDRILNIIWNSTKYNNIVTDLVLKCHLQQGKKRKNPR